MFECALCGEKVTSEPIITFENMPFAAQGFLKKDELDKDEVIDLKIYQCLKCGLVQTDRKKIVPYYKDVIRAVAYSDEMKKFRLKQFENIAKKYHLNNKKAIEIGCGKGEYLGLIKQFINNSFGLENNMESVETAKKKGLNVFQGYLDNENITLPNAPYDAFFIMSFLEHVPNLNGFLKAIYNNLTEDGIGVIEVPNFDMIVEKGLFAEFISDHIYYFTQDTIKRTLEMNGFDVLEINNIWNDYIISVIVKKRKKLDVSKFFNFENNLKKEFEKLINKCKNIDEILNLPDINILTGFTIGRVDFTASMGKDRSFADSGEMLNYCKKIFSKARSKNLRCGLGGAISAKSEDFITELINNNLIDKYETGKIIYSKDTVKNIKEGILKGIEFELLWLKSKKRYYIIIELKMRMRKE